MPVPARERGHFCAAGERGRLAVGEAAFAGTAPAAAHGAHVGEIQISGLYSTFVSCQLAADCLSAQGDKFAKGLDACVELLCRAEFGGVLLHVRANHFSRLRDQSFQFAVCEPALDEFREQLVILLGIAFVGEDPADHGPVVQVAVDRFVDEGVDRGGGVAGLEGAEGQVVVPGDHAELAVLLVQIVVVDHAAGIAVAVDDEIVDHEVAKDLVHIQDRFQVFIGAELLQGGNQPLLIGGGDLGLGVVEDVGVAVRIIVDILQLHVVAAHAAGAAPVVLSAGEARLPAGEALPGSLPPAGEAALLAAFAGLAGELTAGEAALLAAFAGLAGELTAGEAALLAAFAGLAGELTAGEAALLAAFAAGIAFLTAAGAAFPLGRGLAAGSSAFCGLGLRVGLSFGVAAEAEVEIQVVKIEILAVAAAAAEAHAVRLVELAGVGAVVPGQEAVLHALHGQIEAPVLAIHRQIRIGAEGSVGPEVRHQPITQVILHHGVVLDQVVQAELIKTVQGFAGLVVVEFQLEAVALTAHGLHGGQGGVALSADGDVRVLSPVHHHSAGCVLLVLAVLYEAVPIVHHDVDPVDIARIEQRALIFYRLCRDSEAQRAAKHEEDRQHQGQGDSGKTDLVNMLAR